MAGVQVPWEPDQDPSTVDRTVDHPEDIEGLRTRLEQIKEAEAQVGHRKTELIQNVRDRINTLHRLLVEYGAASSIPMQTPVATESLTPHVVKTRGRRNQVSIIAYVRREMERVGHPLATAELRQALLTRHHVPELRLKNLSQILYKAQSIVKADGKIGLAEWQSKTPAAGKHKSVKKSRTATKPAVASAAAE